MIVIYNSYGLRKPGGRAGEGSSVGRAASRGCVFGTIWNNSDMRQALSFPLLWHTRINHGILMPGLTVSISSPKTDLTNKEMREKISHRS